MDLITILIIALGLSMDAFAVSVTSGFTLKKLMFGNAFKIAAFFGGFQALMPFVGWLAGKSLQEYIANYDHWVAFIVLSFIGGKMIYEAFVIEEAEKEVNCSNSIVLLGLAIATSIDALAVGVSMSIMSVNIIEPVIIIGIITFILSLAGVYIGKRFGNFFENKIEIFGGIILIGIGIKILVEHLFFS